MWLCPPPSAFPHQRLPFPMLLEGDAGNSRTAYETSFAVNGAVWNDYRGIFFLEVTSVFHQGTKPSCQSSVFQDPIDSFGGQLHIEAEKKRSLHRALVTDGPPTPPPPPQSTEPFCFTVPSNEYGAENWWWKEKGTPPPPWWQKVFLFQFAPSLVSNSQ